MVCPNCKAKLPNEAKYCPRCGLLFSLNDVEKLGSRVELDLLRVYFPDKKIKFNFHNISIIYLFLNFIYAFYKKLYMIGIFSLISLVLFIHIVVGGPQMLFFRAYGFMFLPTMFAAMFAVGIYIYYVLTFNNHYITSVKARINKIVRENPSASGEELVELCKKDSKPNYIAVIISILVFLYVLKELFLI